MVLELDTSGQGYKTTFTLPFYQGVEQVLLSLQVMKVQRIIKGVHNVSSAFCQFLKGGWQL